MTAMLRVLVSAAAIGSVACATTTQPRLGSSTTAPSGPVAVNESRPASYRRVRSSTFAFKAH